MNNIGWCDVTWNPVTGCSPVSPACDHCYARRTAVNRLAGRFGYPADDPFRVTLHPERLQELSHWRKPRRVFVVSMGDLFHEEVPDEFIWRIFDTMTRGNRRHTYLILTKRPLRMSQWFLANQERFWHFGQVYVDASWATPLWPDPCLQLGTTTETQEWADKRIPDLMATPAAVRFVSVEPILGPILFRNVPGLNKSGAGPGLDWVICGGETGPGARPPHPDWVRSLRDQCQNARVPFWFKGWGGVTRPKGFWHDGVHYVGNRLDGVVWQQRPRDI